MVKFSVDWFSNNISIWKKHLDRYKDQEICALEIGSYEGMSASWLLSNILTHPRSRIFCVDNFTQKDKKTRGNVETTFMSNMAEFPTKKWKLLKGDSSDMLKLPSVLKMKFDIIYIDSNHHSRHVLEDAVLAFALLKPGGIMIFDDNTNNKEHDNNCPKPAIISFLNAYSNEVKVMYSKWQVVLTKRSQPLRTSPCYSEFYLEPKH